MSRRTTGLAVAAVGLVLGAVSALADVIGAGEWRGFGADQIKGTVGGAVILLIGLLLVLAPARQR